MNKTAQGLAALGRGPDTQLVHMAPSEVKSLQSLALAHGGTLTTNPETGLPEAGFLSSILPMVIGAGLAATGVGAPMAGLLVGGAQAMRKGSLREGITAGLGAYGGAGLGGALAGAGTSAMGSQAATAAQAANPQLMASEIGREMGQAGFTSPSFAANMNPAAATGLDRMQAGAQGLMGAPGRQAFMQNIGGGMGLASAGMAAAAPMMATVTQQPEFKSDKNMGQRYSYTPGALSPTPSADVPGYGNQGQDFGREQTYFRPSYNKISDVEAKNIYGYADGGPVEAMSNMNAIGVNTGYPQSDINVGAYATPYQQPISRNVVTGAQDAAVSPFTGQADFAEGGAVDPYVYDPATQRYIKSSQQDIQANVAPGQRYDDGGAQGKGENDWSDLSPTEQANFYSENPLMANITQMGQNVMGLTSLGMAQSTMDPVNVAMQSSIAHGVSPEALGMVATQAEADAIGQAMAEAASSTSASDAAAAASAAAGADSVGSGGADGSAASGDGADGGAAAAADGGGAMARGGLAALARGGMYNLGGYSDGGRLLRGPGDGVSDSIPAVIGKKQPARLADGEFVIPARIVSELGNGSTEAGARKLYAMMDRVQKSRGKTVGKGKVAANSRAEKHLPA